LPPLSTLGCLRHPTIQDLRALLLARAYHLNGGSDSVSFEWRAGYSVSQTMAKYSRWRPEWTRAFVVEPDEKNEAEDGGVTSAVPWPAVALFALFAASTVLTIVSFLEQKSAFGIALITLAGASLAWTAITRPQTASGFLALTSGVLFFLQAFTLITNWEHEDFSNLARHLSSINLGIGAALIVLTLNINFRSSHRSQSDISKPGSLPSSEERSPEDNLTLVCACLGYILLGGLLTSNSGNG
jgi:hypothetical protein